MYQASSSIELLCPTVWGISYDEVVLVLGSGEPESDIAEF
jgi:hypothetical protein